jgi:RNA polymerase sigma-70 factor (ECF subfamily)
VRPSPGRGIRARTGGSAAARAPHEDQVRALYLEHGGSLLNYTYRLTGDRHLAEDIVQETLVRAWQNAATLSSEVGSIRGWLLTVARNIAVDQARARRIRPPEAAGELTETNAAGMATADHSDDVARAIAIRAALQSISVDHREVLIEVYFKGKTAAEAGESLGIPAGTIRSRAHYAIRALRSVLTVELREVTA